MAFRTARDSVFACDLTLVPCLYYTAWACRRPRIRRRAIELLRHQAPREENLWTADACLHAIESVVVFEERGRGRTTDDGGYAPTVSDEEDRLLPPVEHRLPMSRLGAHARLPPGIAVGLGCSEGVSNLAWERAARADAAAMVHRPYELPNLGIV